MFLCLNCNKELLVKEHPNGPQKTKFCDLKCKLAFHGRKRRKNKTYKMYDITCEVCKKQHKSENKNCRFCSYGCRGIGLKKFLDIPSCIEGANRKLDKNIGYVRIYAPMHPEANTWGYVYEHRIIAEQVIGRRLLSNEIVHHKNGKRWDNRPENLEVMDKSDHGKLKGQRPEDLQI